MTFQTANHAAELRLRSIFSPFGQRDNLTQRAIERAAPWLMALHLLISSAALARQPYSDPDITSKEHALSERSGTHGSSDIVGVKETPRNAVDERGHIKDISLSVPYSTLASEVSLKNFIENIVVTKIILENMPMSIAQRRLAVDRAIMEPGVSRLRRAFKVNIEEKRIAGVLTDVITPIGTIPKKNQERILINLRGGGFISGTRLGGQMESIPIASLGMIKVISVDYGQYPEHKFPAATEDVAKVYRELLRQYRPENIGIYGCSAGGWLVAQSIGWFYKHDLPRPGAIGLFSAGAMVFDGVTGDSAYTSWSLSAPGVLMGKPNHFTVPYFDVVGLDIKDPIVSPVYSQESLSRFPPSLIISGTRDYLLSQAVYTHSQLIKAGVDADLHIWEGAYHCSFAQGTVDPDVPENREAWNVIVKFFDAKLGSEAASPQAHP